MRLIIAITKHNTAKQQASINMATTVKTAHPSLSAAIAQALLYQ